MSGYTYATPACTGACTAQNEATLQSNLESKGPVSVCVDAEPWQHYTGGIMTASSGCLKGYNDLDHCVQLVGHNSAGATPYWLVRNQWATNWGQAGYIYLQKGINLCGIADEATFVTLK